MLRTLIICTVVSASFIACASTPSPKPTASAARNLPADCIRDTGSRIATKPATCQNVPGRSYSQDDIDRTGQTDAANALRMLDPSVTVHH